MEKCPKCRTKLKNCPGIGPFCPNRQCDVADNIDQVRPAWNDDTKDEELVKHIIGLCWTFFAGGVFVGAVITFILSQKGLI